MVRFFELMLTQVGKYQIVEKIGVGGFGTVYKGRDPFIKRLVAIKTCQSSEEEIRKRFFREAEFAGNLHHRNVTTIYDFGVTDDGTPYIVQEFLTGEDLDKIIKKRRPMSLQRKVDILVDVCEGLGYAHAAGIIHRDIKPSNIRILDDGTVKIMDFGIAKSMVTPSTLTQTGITLGTASYLAPEQIRGETLDARTDIFSVGVLAYELLTGQKPFTGDHISTVLYKIMNEAPPRPGEIDPAIPRALEAAVARSLEKDRSNRYASCAELRADLSASLRGVSPDAITRATVIHVVADGEKTVATPSGGLSRPTSAQAAPPAATRPATGPTGTVAEVRLRSGDTGSAPIPVLPKKRGGGVRIAAGVAALVVLGVLGGYVAFRGRTVIEIPPTPPAPTAEPTSPPALPSPAPPTSAEVPTAPAATAVPEVVPTVRETPGPVTVTFESNQPAQLTIGGRKYSGLPAPVRVPLMPGKYVAVFDVAKFRKLDEAFEVRPGTAPFVVRVNFPAWGFLEVTSDPSGAEVRVDGKAAGATPLKKGYPVGVREVEVRLRGYETARQSAEVREADVVRVAIPLRKGT